MPARPLPEKFQVAFSFAGEQRDLVRAVAEAVENKIGRGTVFLDEWYEPFLAGFDADLKLQKIYGQQCELGYCVYFGAVWWQTVDPGGVFGRQGPADAASIIPGQTRRFADSADTRW
jgi:hypothetical protein